MCHFLYVMDTSLLRYKNMNNSIVVPQVRNNSMPSNPSHTGVTTNDLRQHRSREWAVAKRMTLTTGTDPCSSLQSVLNTCIVFK